jgi:hypothetical protein
LDLLLQFIILLLGLEGLAAGLFCVKLGIRNTVSYCHATTAFAVEPTLAWNSSWRSFASCRLDIISAQQRLMTGWIGSESLVAD